MRFKLSSKDLSGKTAIIVEIDEKPSKKNKKLPDDYWGFIPFDAQQEENSVKPNRKVLSCKQVARPLLYIYKIFSINMNMHFCKTVTHTYTNCRCVCYVECWKDPDCCIFMSVVLDPIRDSHISRFSRL